MVGKLDALLFSQRHKRVSIPLRNMKPFLGHELTPIVQLPLG
jgi:hypothetical protein